VDATDASAKMEAMDRTPASTAIAKKRTTASAGRAVGVPAVAPAQLWVVKKCHGRRPSTPMVDGSEDGEKGGGGAAKRMRAVRGRKRWAGCLG